MWQLTTKPVQVTKRVNSKWCHSICSQINELVFWVVIVGDHRPSTDSPFEPCFWPKILFVTGIFSKAPFSCWKYQFLPCFWGFNALFCNQLSVLCTFSLQFWPKLSLTMSNLLHSLISQLLVPAHFKVPSFIAILIGSPKHGTGFYRSWILTNSGIFGAVRTLLCNGNSCIFITN